MDRGLVDQGETPTLPIHRDLPPAESAAEMPASKPEPVPEETSVPCPRCGGKLIDPDSLGWCSKCGYCRSLAEGAASVLQVTKSGQPERSSLGAAEFGKILEQLPQWVWVLLAGVAFFAGLGLAGNFLLRQESLARALWSTAQLLLGLLALLAAQIWCLVILAPDDDKLGAKDAVFASRLWGLAFRRLPEMRRQVWLGGWGISAALSAIFAVGGFSYWYQFYQPKKFAEKSLISAAQALAHGKDKAQSLEEAVEDLAKTQDLTKQKDENKPDTRPVLQCVIIGYTVDGKDLSGLVLASTDGERLRYFGVVRRGFTPAASKEILGKLTALTRSEPVIRGLTISSTIWVEPELFCEVHHSGLDRDGLLLKPNFAGLLDAK